MKIAYIFCHWRGGGAEENALYLAREALKNNHEVFFILGDEKDKIELEGVSRITIPMESSFNPFKILRSVLELKRFVTTNNIQIVHAHMLREHSIALGAKFLGAKIKVVRTFHRLDQFNLKMLPLLWFYSWQTDSFIAVSNYLSKYLKNNGLKKKVTVIYNGVPEAKAQKHQKNIGYLGRITEEKGILDFVKANVENLKETKLVIGGDGPQAAELKDLTTQNSLNVELLGRITDRDKYFEKISILILPSRSEVMPLVVLEAFSAGVPVVAFDMPSLHELINTENGKLVEFQNKHQLFQEAIMLMNDQKAQAGAKKTYEEKYNIGKMWRETEKLYKSLEVK